jgi:membrane-associated phospholipid phosphatase
VRRPSVWLIAAWALAAALAFALDSAAYSFHRASFHLSRDPVADPVTPSLAWPHHAMHAFEKCGEGLFGIMIGAALWSLAPHRRGQVVCLALASLTTVLTVEAIKRSTGRLRPDVAAGATAFHGFKFARETKADGHSFPSGHVAAIGAYGGVLSVCAPPLRALAVIAAAGTGCSRMWHERHFLSDVVVGGLLGWLIGAGMAGSARLQPYWSRWNARLAPR